MLSGLRKVWDERLKKIYRVVGHPTTEKVAKLLKDAVEEDPVIMNIFKKDS